MSDKVLKYKEYLGSIEVSIGDECLYGKILHIEDLITYESESPKGLEAAFISAVDEYLEFCEEQGKSPDVPFKGTFNTRIGEDLHKSASIAAKIKGITLNEFIKMAVSDALEDAPNVTEPKSRPLLAIPSAAASGLIRKRSAEYRVATTGEFYQESYARGSVTWQEPQKAKSH
jgi:predicted HicB family RNase H-like nuclease